MLGKPFFHHLLSTIRHIAFRHFECLDIKHSHLFIVQCINMSGLVLLGLKEHLYDDPIKTTYFRHISISFVVLLTFLSHRFFTLSALAACFLHPQVRCVCLCYRNLRSHILLNSSSVVQVFIILKANHFLPKSLRDAPIW